MIKNKEVQTTSEIGNAEIGMVLSSVAYAEHRLLTMATLFATDEPTNSHRLRRKVMKWQGTKVGWPINHGTCNRVLQAMAEKGLASTTANEDGTTSYNANTEHKLLAEGITGHLLQWSLVHDELGLNDPLGRKASSGDDGVSTQNARLEIVEELLSNNGDDQSTQQVGNSVGLSNKRSDNLVNDLAVDGVVKIHKAADASMRILHITDTTRDNAVPLESTSETNQAFYTVIESMRAEGIEEIDAESVMLEMQKLLPSTPISEIRDKVSKNMANSTMSKTGVRASGNIHEGGKHTRVELNDQHIEALQALVNIFLNAKDPAFLLDGQSKLQTILKSPTNVSKLMRKAHSKSKIANAPSMENTLADMAYILESTGELTTKQILEYLRERQGDNVKPSQALHVAHELVNAGRARAIRDLGKTTARTHLSLVYP